MNKQETWKWIQANDKTLAKLLQDIAKYMGKPDKVVLK